MRTSLGFLFVTALAVGAGACADEDDPYLPNVPGPTDVVEPDEPQTAGLARNERDLERGPSASIDQGPPIDDAFELGRLARSRLDRLRAAGFAHASPKRTVPDECTVGNPGPDIADGLVGVCHFTRDDDNGSGAIYTYIRVAPDACRAHRAEHAFDFRSDDPLCQVLPRSARLDGVVSDTVLAH